MKYQSTRGGENGLTFRDVLFSGYAKVRYFNRLECIGNFIDLDL